MRLKAFRWSVAVLASLQLSSAYAKLTIRMGYSNDHDSSNMLTCAQWSEGDSSFDRLFSYFKDHDIQREEKKPAIAPKPEFIAARPEVASPAPSAPIAAPEVTKPSPMTPRVVENRPDGASTLAELESKPHLVENLKFLTSGKTLERGKKYSWDVQGRVRNIDGDCYQTPSECRSYKALTPTEIHVTRDGKLITSMNGREMPVTKIWSDGKTAKLEFTYYQKHCKYEFFCDMVGPFKVTTQITGTSGNLSATVSMIHNGEKITMTQGVARVGEMQTQGSNDQRIAGGPRGSRRPSQSE